MLTQAFTQRSPGTGTYGYRTFWNYIFKGRLHRRTKYFPASSVQKALGESSHWLGLGHQGWQSAATHGYYGWHGEREAPKGREGMFQEEGGVPEVEKSHIYNPGIFQTQTATYIGQGVMKIIPGLQSAEIKNEKGKTEQNQTVPNSITFCETFVLIMAMCVWYICVLGNNGKISYCGFWF